MRYLYGVFLAVLATTLSAADNITVQFSLTYYICVKPSRTPACVAAAPSPSECHPCATWRKAVYTGGKTLTASAMVPAANDFAANIAKQYGYTANTQWSSTDLYNDPQRYGFTEIPATTSKEGTIVVWPGMAGVVVDDASTTSEVSVLYPSAKSQAIIRRNIGTISRSAPKFLIPTESLQLAAEQELRKNDLHQ